MNISKDIPRFFLFALIAGLVLILLKQWVSFSSDYDAAVAEREWLMHELAQLDPNPVETD